MAKRYSVWINPFSPTQPFRRHHWCQVGVDDDGRYILFVEDRVRLGVHGGKHSRSEIRQAREQMAAEIGVEPSTFYRIRFVKALPFEVTSG